MAISRIPDKFMKSPPYSRAPGQIVKFPAFPGFPVALRTLITKIFDEKMA